MFAVQNLFARLVDHLVCCLIVWVFGDFFFLCVFFRVSKKPREMKGKNSKKISLKYTAARLHEKGVLLEIEDLQSNQ